LACGLIVTAGLLAWRFHRITGRAAPVRRR